MMYNPIKALLTLNMRTVPRKIGTATIVATLVIMSTGPALAGNCEKTIRDAPGKLEVYTKVVNETSKDLNLSITRCQPGDCEVISQSTVSPGKNIDKLTKGGSPQISVHIGKNEICRYNIDKTSNDKTKWERALNYTKTIVCKSQYEISCDKSFNPNKKRWSTKFVLREKK